MNRNEKITHKATLIAVALGFLAIGYTASSNAQSPGVPQIPAMLPDQYSVPPTEALPIDGVWLISSIRKKIRIDQGRAYAVDPWLHMFVLKVEPGMVVLQNFRRTGPGQYAADDLPLMGPAAFTLTAQGNLSATVQGMFGPIRYELVRIQPQFPEQLTAEIQAATNQQIAMPGYTPAPPPVTAPPPTYVSPPPVAGSPPAPPADCTPIGVDPDTNQTICAY